jgi:hypothetical protein
MAKSNVKNVINPFVSHAEVRGGGGSAEADPDAEENAVYCVQALYPTVERRIEAQKRMARKQIPA